MQEFNCKDRNREDWTIDIPPPASKSMTIKQVSSNNYYSPVKYLSAI